MLLKNLSASSHPAARKHREKTGGRKKGTPNKRTVEALIQEQRKAIGQHKAGGAKLAVDHMDEMIEHFRGVVGILQPWSKDEEGKWHVTGDTKLFFKAAETLGMFLAMRAPYQSPRLSSVQIIPQQSGGAERTVVNVTILNERGQPDYTEGREIEGKALPAPLDGEIVEPAPPAEKPKDEAA